MNHYRYVDGMDAMDLYVHLETYVVVKETPKGYWVVPEWRQFMGDSMKDSSKRWVSKDSRRRYCYPDKDEAWESYVIRKRYHLNRLAHQYDLVQKRMKALKDIDFKRPRDENNVHVLTPHGIPIIDY